MPGLVPNFLVVGAGRSGTTGLVEGLRTHPSVFVTEPKEPHFFALHDRAVEFAGPGDAATINRVAVTDRDSYLSLFHPEGSYACLGDGSVSTMYYHERSIPAIVSMNPQMRIVVMLREPVDRAYSSFQYMGARGFETSDTFLDAVDAEQTRREHNWHHLWHYTAMSRYAESLAAFLSQFGDDQVGVWFYDDLQRDYEATVQEVLRFIGAPPVEGEATGVPRVNISGTPRSAAAHRVIWAATRNERVRSTLKRLTSYRVREYVRRVTLRSDAVDATTRATLAPRYAEDLRQLAALLEDRVERLPDWLTAAR